MANAFIGYDNVVERSATVLAVDAELSTLPITNIAHAHVAKVWRSGGTTAAIDIDAGSSVAADFVALFGYNGTASATFRIRASDTAFATGDLLDSTVLSPGDLSDPHDSHLYVFGSTITARYWRIDLVDATLQTLECGIVFLAPMVQPARNAAWPFQVQRKDLSLNRRTVGGQVLTYELPQIREATVNWGALTEAELYSSFLDTLDKTAGVAKNVVFVPDSAHTYLHEIMFIGRLSKIGPALYQTLNLYSHDYVITEVK